MSLTVTVNAADFFGYARIQTATWENVIQGNGDGVLSPPFLQASEAAGSRFCSRAAFEFDTSIYTRPTSAILFVKNQSAASGTNNQMQILTWTPTGAFNAASGFQDIYTAMADEDNYGGSMSIDDVSATDLWRSPDLVAAGLYEVSSTYHLGLFNDHWDNFANPVDPVASLNAILLEPTTTVPFLSLTLDPELAIDETLKNDEGVSDIVGARVYPIVRSQGAALPAVTYQRISTPRIRGLDGRAGLQSPRFQINCWAETYTVAVKLAHFVGKALDDLSGTIGGLLIRAVDLDDEDDLEDISPGNRKDRIFGRRLDFIVWAREDT